jgi:hypothetical protein
LVGGTLLDFNQLSLRALGSETELITVGVMNDEISHSVGLILGWSFYVCPSVQNCAVVGVNLVTVNVNASGAWLLGVWVIESRNMDSYVAVPNSGIFAEPKILLKA